MFHHSHSNCQCSTKTGPDFRAFQCRPGCNSSMPTGAERDMPGYSWWWDLFNVSTFFHSQGYDVFILSMPLKGVNLGPGVPHPEFTGGSSGGRTRVTMRCGTFWSPACWL